MSMKRNASLVYSSELGRICPKCDKPVTGCICKQTTMIASKADSIVRVGRESKGRKGKGVTLISGVPLTPEGLKDLARELKQKCGSGGTLKNGVIEIQGDHRDILTELLKAKGWTVKRSGG
ncbi:MAG: translation initiation factor Sui1 [Desulfuromonadales bacterium]|nr:translation initiation factor Sui1 [Desulfuromonadales bacterium]